MQVYKKTTGHEASGNREITKEAEGCTRNPCWLSLCFGQAPIGCYGSPTAGESSTVCPSMILAGGGCPGSRLHRCPSENLIKKVAEIGNQCRTQEQTDDNLLQVFTQLR